MGTAPEVRAETRHRAVVSLVAALAFGVVAAVTAWVGGGSIGDAVRVVCGVGFWVALIRGLYLLVAVRRI